MTIKSVIIFMAKHLIVEGGDFMISMSPCVFEPFEVIRDW